MPYGTINTGTITPGSGNTLTINEIVDGTAIKDQDNMSSNSATHLATQQSIKAYTDGAASQATTAAQGVGTGNTPTFAGLKTNNGASTAIVLQPNYRADLIIAQGGPTSTTGLAYIDTAIDVSSGTYIDNVWYWLEIFGNFGGSFDQYNSSLWFIRGSNNSGAKSYALTKHHAQTVGAKGVSNCQMNGSVIQYDGGSGGTGDYRWRVRYGFQTDWY